MEWIGGSFVGVEPAAQATALWGPTDSSQWANVSNVAYDGEATCADDLGPGYIVRTICDVAFTAVAESAQSALYEWAVMYVDYVQGFDETDYLPVSADLLSSDSVLAHGIEMVNLDTDIIVSSGLGGIECDAQVTRESDDKSGIVLLTDGPSGVVSMNVLSRTLVADESEGHRL